MKKAFTLIELLVVIAIIAILAAILFPVFAQAKQAAKITSSLSGLKQLAIGLQLYSGDFDDVAVPDYGYATPEEEEAYLNHNTWVGRVFPYVKSRSLFFDKTLADPSGENFVDPFYPKLTYKWEWITNFSLNVDGYSRAWSGSDCLNIDWSGEGSYRNLTSIDNPAQRLAIAPTRYAQLPFSWMRFYGIDAAWPTMDRYASDWSWYQLIFDARKQYGARFVGAYADGHAAKFGKEKFVSYYVDTPSATEANTYTEYCTVATAKDIWKFWGKAWSGN
jgi:prepilin-type N-terminal cleavage/methylation domain-containing protein